MPRAKSKPRAEGVNPDYVRMYYEHQYDRIKRYEEEALTISNIVLTISALVITFGLNNRQSFGEVLVMLLPVVIIAVNGFAISYVWESSKWIKFHRVRARTILNDYASQLSELDNKIVVLHTNQTVSRKAIQYLIHILFMIIGLVLLILFILDIVGVSVV